MLHDLFAWALATFLFQPLETRLAEAGRAAPLPTAVVQQAQGCLSTAAPALVARADADPFWGITTVLGVAVGLTAPEAVIAGASPACGWAIDAVRPHLG